MTRDKNNVESTKEELCRRDNVILSRQKYVKYTVRLHASVFTRKSNESTDSSAARGV